MNFCSLVSISLENGRADLTVFCAPELVCMERKIGKVVETIEK